MKRAFGLALIALCILTTGCGLRAGTSYTVSGRIVCADDDSQGIGHVHISFTRIRSAASSLGLRQVVAGKNYAVFLRTDGTVYLWGSCGSVYTYGAAMLVPGIDGIVAVAAGGRHSLALRADGTVWAWGANAGNYLGTGAYSAIIPPTMVIGISGAAGVASGEQVIAAVDCLGDLWHWGMSYPGASPAILYPIGEPRRIAVL